MFTAIASRFELPASVDDLLGQYQADIVELTRPVRGVVGDSARHDIEGAQHLGLSTAWLPRGHPWPHDRPRPTVVVEDLASLPTQVVEAS